jgi:hypothetical protein
MLTIFIRAIFPSRQRHIPQQPVQVEARLQTEIAAQIGALLALAFSIQRSLSRGLRLVVSQYEHGPQE